MSRKNRTIIFLAALLVIFTACTTTGRGAPERKYDWNDGPYLIQSGSSGTSVTVCWITTEKRDSTLVWGTSESDLSNTITSSDSRVHSVLIEGLLPGSNYFYSIQEEFLLFPGNEVFDFSTPADPAGDEPLEIIIAGDLQPKNEYTLMTNRIVAEQIDREDPDFIIQVGDAVQTGSSSESWHNLMSSLPLMASERPIIPAIGNHEYYFPHDNGSFRSVFPYNYSAKKSCYYSLDIGEVHITVLDPYDGGPAGLKAKMTEKQKQWFISDLDSAVREGAGWIFVVLHQTVLTSGEFFDDVELRKWILPILSDHDIDAAFWGHTHFYEHWEYQYGENGYLLSPDDKPGNNPVDYFVIGSSGASLESNYDLLYHKPFTGESHSWYNTNTGLMEEIETIQYPWNPDVFFEGEQGKNQFNDTDLHFYQLPFDLNGEYSSDPLISYATDNQWFGYQYGENTLHYAKLSITDDECIVTIHYPDGTLLSGPDGSIPQRFTLPRKRRN
ncbi:MAG: metallophosphoesterase family protein [Spirochaetales bacterium]|nr:metallophosphoesterase family protein [Spirochaetales bacterium]